ncbi:hypothetical protein HD597_000064 [Nonomuraea thailandensis]|uniref:Uncharacterized protein n=1 Tax=Nonomuraea thailandensis TaxID=1188745 RepID=A0A9X2G909_9ACTN|nr:hypothetical protein [Nonomuraea thailandensis]MCP2353044.1 hypothetical protein [Nonomuraea thailandensis]
MRPDDRLFPDPDPDSEAPRAFTDAADGGYPIETDLDPDPHPAPQSLPTDEDLPPPPSPLSGRRLHNPIPAAPTAAAADDDWYGPEPARSRWRIITPIATLVASAGLGIWLALPTTPPPQANAPTSPSTAHPTAPPSSGTPAARHTFTPRPTTARTRATSPTPRPEPTRTRSPRPQQTTARPSPDPHPAITTTVTLTVRPTRARTGTGPEEPPRPTPPTTRTPACLTWDDCHDDPPTG